MKAGDMIPRLLLILTGTGIAGDAIYSVLRGDVVSGGTALAMVIIYFALLRKIDSVRSANDIFQAKISDAIADINKHLGEITKTVIRSR